jgi:hypothetical protein
MNIRVKKRLRGIFSAKSLFVKRKTSAGKQFFSDPVRISGFSRRFMVGLDKISGLFMFMAGEY